MNTVVVIQARMGSTRFPGKVLAPLAGETVIDHVIRRARLAQVGRVIAAIPGTVENVPLERHLRDRLWTFDGSETDVLGRFLGTVCTYAPDADAVVRITGDCPLVDPAVIRFCVEQFTKQEGAFYVGRCNDPDGTDCEVFPIVALLKAHREAGPDQREHVTTWIRATMPCLHVTAGEDVTGLKYSVDTPEDLAVCERLIAECGPDAGWRDHVAALRRWKETA